MSYYAKIENNIVVQVLIANESPGAGFVLLGSKGQAGIGFTKDGDVFRAPQPFASWRISDDRSEWLPPVGKERPVGGIYDWDEPEEVWVDRNAGE